MRVWAPVGQTPVVQVSASRDNTHFYGVLNLATGKEITMLADKMTSDVSVLFLLEILSAYPSVPILLLWDRATWHKGEAVRSLLASHPRLSIFWFPPGCPELNPQEHVWKAVREAVSHNHGKTKLSELADAFEENLKANVFPCSLLSRHNYHTICSMFK
jgi:transposase